MKPCEYSKETQDVLKEILVNIEHFRNSANEKRDYPPSDYHFRPCQSIIAERLGFEHRAEWCNDDYLGFETRL